MILVAVWKNPFVFQGSFNVKNKQDDTNELLFFRCECYSKNKDAIQNEFSPHDYKFTHLHNEKSEIPLTDGEKVEQALYLLKYALKSALEKLINNPRQHQLYVDEVAMSYISNQAKDYMINGQEIADNDVGFAVSIDFIPKENSGKMAASALLEFCGFGKKDNIH